MPALNEPMSCSAFPPPRVRFRTSDARVLCQPTCSGSSSLVLYTLRTLLYIPSCLVSLISAFLYHVPTDIWSRVSLRWEILDKQTHRALLVSFEACPYFSKAKPSSVSMKKFSQRKLLHQGWIILLAFVLFRPHLIHTSYGEVFLVRFSKFRKKTKCNAVAFR